MGFYYCSVGVLELVKGQNGTQQTTVLIVRVRKF
jgi:hypothetical protein